MSAAVFSIGDCFSLSHSSCKLNVLDVERNEKEKEIKRPPPDIKENIRISAHYMNSFIISIEWDNLNTMIRSSEL